tara:strand:- start:1110 stop:1484 length:375 start_codon:yes stop_codon:yes gene_type:complete
VSKDDINDGKTFLIERAYLGRWLRLLAREKVMAHSLVKQHVDYDLEDPSGQMLFAIVCEYYAACNQLEEIINKFLTLPGPVKEKSKDEIPLSQLEYMSFNSYIIMIETHRITLRDKYNISLEIN